ncbi:MAG: alpha/beta hydrolase-fold protein [Caldilineaceae bacterium]
MKIESPRLQHVQRALSQGDRVPLAQLWAEVAITGAPLIEPSDAENCLVTFLWRDPGHTQSVAVIQDWGADGIYEHFMTQLPGSDLWFKTRLMRSDTRTTYQLAPTPPSDPTSSIPYQLDPLNPRTHIAFLGEDGNHIRFSSLELPTAPAQPWREHTAPKGTIRLYHLPGGGRRAWVYLAPSVHGTDVYDLPGRLGGYPLLVAFDGRPYKEHLQVPALLDYLVATAQIPPLVALFIDNPNRQELVCAAAFADYVAQTVMPWLVENFPVTTDPAQTVVTGSSYGGLGAAYLALRYPQRFGKVLSQTGWFRWRPEGDPAFHWLARQYAQTPPLPLQFYLDVGNLEVAQMRDGGPTQFEANRHMRDVLLAKGYPVRYVEYSGGHDYSSVEAPLAAALAALFGQMQQ